jgi:hypothetical protein
VRQERPANSVGWKLRRGDSAPEECERVSSGDRQCSWARPLIESAAAAVDDAGFRTHVRDDAGRIVILTGVATVDRLARAC